MNKHLKIITALSLAFTMLFGITAFANDLNSDTEAESNIEIEEVDPYIYEMIEAYENGTFIERNDSETFKPSEMFNEITPLSNSSEDIDYIYDLRKIDENIYEATQISLYASDNEDTSQRTKYGVKIFCTIVFEEKYFDEVWPYIMLNRVKGGVLEEAQDYEAIELRMGYTAEGDAYNSNGTRIGSKRLYKSPSSYRVNNPLVGPAYSIAGPKTYYFNSGIYPMTIAGMVEVDIENSNGSTATVEASTTIEEIG